MAKPRDNRDIEAGEAVKLALRSSFERLAQHEARVRRGRSVEAVHQARVAIRRLRSHLKSFRPLVDRAWADALRQELEWLGDELGAVRDLDVLIGRLCDDSQRSKNHAITAARRAAVLARVRGERSAARAVLLRGVSSERYRQLRARLDAATSEPQLTLAAKMPAGKALRGAVRDRWKKLRKAVDALPPAPSTRALHRVRILAKHCRYAAEAAAIAEGEPAQNFAEAAADLQDALGELNDAESARTRLRRFCRDPELAPAAAALLVCETEAAQRARKAWQAVWQRLDRKGLRSWL
jgi:CHAD domain-containing protein